MNLAQLRTVIFAAAITFASCKKSDLRTEETAATANTSLPTASTPIGSQTGTMPQSAYTVVLESKVQNADGSFTWTWSLVNPNPGNGNNGTSQDLSHFNMTFGSCVNTATFTQVAYSYNGNSWSSVNAQLAVDPSQNCVTTPVLKFGATTNGSKKTYFRITTTANYSVDNTAVGNYKSGARTGCGLVWFAGMGCNTSAYND
ncbi:MAG: hypothetical protein EOO16_15345 [Chitinophagaceae bacterium]|nr:MAG: hypothetical protein EOO16_15345 [Chitinophagaceae bacterium]